jgi:hypothetical protein
MFIGKGIYFEQDTGMGGGGDLFGGDTGMPSEADAPVAEPNVAPEGETPPAEEARFEIDGQSLTESEVLAMRDAFQNKQQWESTLKQREGDLSTMEKALNMAHETMRANQQVPPQPQQPQEPQVTPEQFRDMLLDDPANALAWMSQNMNTLAEQKAAEVINRTQAESQFYQKYDDFNQVISTPEFQAFKANNPAYNDVNAYFAMKLEQASQLTEAQKAEYRKEVETELLNNQKAKGQLGTVHTQPGGVPPQAPAQPGSKQEFVRSITQKILASRNEGGQL